MIAASEVVLSAYDFLIIFVVVVIAMILGRRIP